MHIDVENILIKLDQDLQGSILDIGGGGEGIIGRRYGAQVIAIDNRQEELDEAPDGFEKVLMDARQLTFLETSFDHVTFFYSLMFMSKETQKQAIAEAIRVLKTGGYLHIWDAEISKAYPEPFVIDLDIQINDDLVHTTYGIISDLKDQTAESFHQQCKENGLELQKQSSSNQQFYLAYKKVGIKVH